MPMSTSAVVNRAEALKLVESLEQALPTAFAGQDKMVSEREEHVAQARSEQDEIIAEAQRERERILSDTEVAKAALLEADKIVSDARTEADELRKETDEYVDTRLATFEVTLTKTLEAVARGRAALHGRSDLDALAVSNLDDAGADDILTTPDELRPAEHDRVG